MLLRFAVWYNSKTGMELWYYSWKNSYKDIRTYFCRWKSYILIWVRQKQRPCSRSSRNIFAVIRERTVKNRCKWRELFQSHRSCDKHRVQWCAKNSEPIQSRLFCSNTIFNAYVVALCEISPGILYRIWNTWIFRWQCWHLS